MMRLFFLAVAMICCIGFLGCDFPEQKRPMSAPGGLDIDTGGSAAAQSPSESAASNAETKPVEPVAPEARKTAEVGDGSKGQYRQKFGRMSIFDTTIGTMYRTKENLTYNVLIPQAMKLYQANNDRFPRTHEEFMKEIIQPNNIKLPDLKDGCRYEYNPQKAELEVVYPINE